MKTILFLPVLLALHCISLGQSGKLSAGVAAGPAFSGLTSPYPVNQNMKGRTRSAIYLTVRVPFGQREKFALHTSIGYEMKGSKLTDVSFVDSLGNTTGAVTPFQNYDYITMPARFSYQKKIGFAKSSLSLHIGAGPYISYLIRRVDKIKGPDIQPTILSKSNVYNSQFDWGISAAAGASYTLVSNFNIDISFVKALGLTNIIAKPDYNNVHPLFRKSHTRTTVVLLGVSYTIPKHAKGKKPTGRHPF